LNENWVGPEGGANFSPALAHLPQLRRLELHGARLGDDGIEKLAPWLSRCTGLTRLNLDLNGITGVGASSLAPVLRTMTNLVSLSLCENALDLAGTEVVALLMPHLPALREVDLARNLLLDEQIPDLLHQKLQLAAVRSNAIGIMFALVSRRNRSNRRCLLSSMPRELLQMVLRHWRLAGGHWSNKSCECCRLRRSRFV
jgi:hypothetical protein